MEQGSPGFEYVFHLGRGWNKGGGEEDGTRVEAERMEQVSVVPFQVSVVSFRISGTSFQLQGLVPPATKILLVYSNILLQFVYLVFLYQFLKESLTCLL